jgi:NAD(P)-dependent dehydrogenase (short-subunit alcohol dehydrogenase family)
MAERTQQVALVTGATSGIGLEIVTTLARRDDMAVFLCSRRHDAVAATVKDLQGQGLTVDGCSCDVRSLEQIQEFWSPRRRGNIPAFRRAVVRRCRHQPNQRLSGN